MREKPQLERLFIAVDLPLDLKPALLALRGPYPALERELRWVRPEVVHLTLKFLGETPGSERERLVHAMGALRGHVRPRLMCRGLGIFGSRTRPRVLWAGVQGDVAVLKAVQQDVEQLCAGLGWPAEERRFDPHITLARTRDRGALRSTRELEALLERYRDHYFGEFEVSEVVLYRSELGSGGSLYTPLLRQPLGG